LLIGRGDPGRGIVPDIDLSKEGSASNSVSRKHARLIIHGNQVYVEDLSSTNGTYLNKQKLQPSQRYLVHHGDELRFGGIILIFYTK
jgi:pSer/pThr/pTyr-binding forkhead associated (FHA) protein